MTLSIRRSTLVWGISLFLLLLTQSCSNENVAPERSYLRAEEYLTNDPIIAGNSGDFVRLYKKKYLYDKGKLVAIDMLDFNPVTDDYDPAYRSEEFKYSTDGKLSEITQFLGSGLEVIKEFTYPSETITQITRYESNNTSGSKVLQDWWTMERTPGSLVVKYYQLNNELYAQLNYTIDGNGNVSSLSREPAFPTGTIHYQYDNSPNPYQFSELGGEYGVDSERYISANNVTSILNDSNNKSTYSIEYSSTGYPTMIVSTNSKRLFTY